MLKPRVGEQHVQMPWTISSIKDSASEAEQSQGGEGSGRGHWRGNKCQITWLLQNVVPRLYPQRF